MFTWYPLSLLQKNPVKSLLNSWLPGGTPRNHLTSPPPGAALVTFQGHQHFRLAGTQATAAGGGGDGLQFEDHLDLRRFLGENPMGHGKPWEAMGCMYNVCNVSMRNFNFVDVWE